MERNYRTSPFFWSRLGFCYDPPMTDDEGNQIVFSRDFAAYRRFHDAFRDAGIDCHTTILHSGWVGVDRYDYRLTDETLAAILGGNPDIYYMPRVKLNVPPDWCEANPTETFVYEKGPRTEEEIRMLVGGPRHDFFGADMDGYPVNGGKNTHGTDRVNRGGLIGLQSFCSPKWRQDAAEALNRLIDHLEASPYKDQIIGYHVAYGCCGETTMWGSWIHGDNKRCGDFGITATRMLREWGINRYGSEEALRRAWHLADGEEIAPPSLAARERENRTLEELFYDGDADRAIIDYFEFLSEENVKSIDHFCRTVKKRGKHLLTGAFYGYTAVPRASHAGHLGIKQILALDSLDFIASPKGYYRALPGDPGGEQAPAQSMARKKIWLDEIDNLTHLDPRNRGAVKNFHETRTTLWREGVKNVTRGQGFWWMDLGEGNFDSPDVMGEIREITELAARLNRKKEGKSVSEILLVTDDRSLGRVSLSYGLNIAFEKELPAELQLAGYPVDCLRLSDLWESDLSQYRLIVFGALWCLTPDERETLLARIPRGATLVFHYAAGILSPNRSLANVPKTTGFTLTPTDVAFDETLGYTAAIKRGVPTGISAVAVYDFPTLAIEEETGVRVLARYPNGRAMLAERTRANGAKTVLAAFPCLRAADFHRLAEEAGCRPFAPAGVTVYADDRMAGFFSSSPVSFTFDASPYGGETETIAMQEKDMKIYHL